MAERVGHLAVTVSPKHVAGRHIWAGTGFYGAIERGVHVFGIDEQIGRLQSGGVGRGGHSGEFISDHEARVADLQLSVHHPTAGTSHAHVFLGAESFLVEGDGPGGITTSKSG